METSFESRLAAVENRIMAAIERSGRKRTDVTLVAVSKKFSSEYLHVAYRCGLRVFGENYVQEFADKKQQLLDLRDAQFHLIGHLQSNKARVAIDLFDAVQTVDSAKLLKRLDSAASDAGKHLQVLLEVKLSGEDSKAGAAPDSLPQILKAAESCPCLNVAGLMTMPPWSENAETSRPYFRHLAALANQFGLKQLSMGMSNDLEVAIEEGATMVRVGTALFGPRPKPAA